MDGRPWSLAVLWQGRERQFPAEREGLARAVRTGALESVVSFDSLAERGERRRPADWDRLLEELAATVTEERTDVLYLHRFHGGFRPDVRPLIGALRRLGRSPIVVTSCGDGFGAPLRRVPRSLLAAAGVSDLVLTTSMGGLAASLIRAGAPRVTLVPNAADDVLFPTAPEPAAVEDDVAFVGSSHPGRNPLRRHSWVSRRRAELVTALQRRFGSRFALYGHGWEGAPSWRGPVPFDRQAEVTRRSGVVVGGFPGSFERCYTSNRVVIALTSGRPLVDWRVDGVDSLLEDRREWVLADDIASTIEQVERLLDDGDLAGRVGTAGALAIDERHRTSHRVDLFVRMCTELVAARDRGQVARCPELDFTVPGSSRAGMSIGW